MCLELIIEWYEVSEQLNVFLDTRFTSAVVSKFLPNHCFNLLYKSQVEKSSYGVVFLTM